jgi:hypothetical protein
MAYNLHGIQKLLQDLETKQKKAETRRHNKKIGYAPKCTVCNDPKLDEIEKLREQHYTLQDIKDYLQLDCSIMALSRHFKNHYPKSQEYKRKQQIQMLENIKEAYIKYPFLEEYFKDKPLQYLEEFNQSKGFCTDRFSLCKYMKASTVSNGFDNVFDIWEEELQTIKEMENSYRYYEREKVPTIKQNFTDKVTYCLNCKNQIQEERLTLLEKIITYNFLNIAPENKELYFNLLQFDGNPEEFIQKLTEAKEENPAK